MEYQFGKGYFGMGARIDAQTVGEELERIERSVGLTPKNVVDESRPEDAPLHGLFEWDDAIAGEKYRITQAGYIIRHVEAKQVSDAKPYRAFVSVESVDVSDGRCAYMTITTALASEPTRSHVLEAAKRELRAFKEKYERLDELACVIAAIDKVA